MDRETSLWNNNEDEDESVAEVPIRPLFNVDAPTRQFSLRELFIPAEIEEDDPEDQEEDADNPKTTRFRKLFKGLFPKIASKDSAPKPETQTSPSALVAELSLPGIARVERAPDAHNEPESAPALPETPQDTLEPSKEETPEGPQVAEIIEPAPPEAPPIPFPNLASAELSRNAITPQSDLPIAIRPNTAPASEIRERNSGAGMAIVAFLGAEFLSRRRDRKLRREIKRTKQGIKKQEAELATIKVSKQRVEQSINERVTHNERITRDQGQRLAEQEAKPTTEITKEVTERIASFERQPTPVIIESSSENIPERTKEQIKQELRDRQEVEKLRAVQEAHEREQALAYIHEREQRAKVRVEKQPTIAIEAEPEDQAQLPEARFDKRHEIKDEPTSVAQISFTAPKPTLTSPTPIANIIKERSQAYSPKQSVPNDNYSHVSNSAPPATDLYVQSVKYGFGAALAIIVVAILSISIV